MSNDHGVLNSNMKNLILGLICLSLLSACTTMSKRECINGEWRENGYQDATRGLTSSRYQSHAKACAKHGIEANNALYTEGYNDGLKGYCRSEVGIRKGRAFNDYRGICPAELEPAFLLGYLQGLNIALDDVRAELQDTRNDLRNARYRRLRTESQTDIRNIDRKIDNLEQEIRDLRQKRNNLRSTISTWLNRV